MLKFIKVLFLIFLYYSNASTIISIYPILHIILKNSGTLQDGVWIYLGMMLSVYELGKFIGHFIWGSFSPKNSHIFLILISLMILTILNLLFGFTQKLIFLIIFRLLQGISNNISKFSREVYIQLGFKENLQYIIFVVSIISTSLAIIIPSVVIETKLNKILYVFFNKIFRIKYNQTNILLGSYLAIVLSNMLCIIFGFILTAKKVFQISKIRNNFYAISYPDREQSTNANVENQNMKDRKIILTDKNQDSIKKPGNSHIISLHKNILGESSPSFNAEKDGESSKTQGDTLDTKDIPITSTNMTNSVRINYFSDKGFKKEYYYNMIHILIEAGDAMALIWSLIILYIQFNDNCLFISLSYVSLKLVAEVVLFPINMLIIKKTQNFEINKILSSMIKINSCLSIMTLLTGGGIGIWYKYKLNFYTFILLYTFFLARNILSSIIVQFYKVFTALDLYVHSIRMVKLRKLNQYNGSLVKVLFFIIGGLGYYYLTEFPQNVGSKTVIWVFLFYYTVLPEIFCLLLLLSCCYLIK